MEKDERIIVCTRFDPSPFRLKVKIICIGGGALNILDKFPTKVIDTSEFFVVANDEDLLNCQKIAAKYSINNLTWNTSNRRLDFEATRRAILDNAYDVGWLFRDADLVIIIACLGGETGSAVAPVLASISCLEANLTLVFATTPAVFESRERHKRAETALKELEMSADTVFYIPMTDARFFDETPQTSEVFAVFDEVVVRAVRAVTETLYAPDGLFCVDFSDLKSLFGSGKKGYFAFGSASGEGRIARVLKDALGQENRLIGGVRLKDAKSVWMHIGGDENLGLDEVHEITRHVEDACHESTMLIFTPVIDKQAGDNVRLTMLASGYD